MTETQGINVVTCCEVTEVMKRSVTWALDHAGLASLGTYLGTLLWIALLKIHRPVGTAARTPLPLLWPLKCKLSCRLHQHLRGRRGLG